MRRNDSPRPAFYRRDIDVHAFAIPHDAADPSLHIRSNGAKMAIVTDLGYMPELVKVHLRGADCLVLESNHDLDMLKVGPYPWVVKQRSSAAPAIFRIMPSVNIFATPTASTPLRAISSSPTFAGKQQSRSVRLSAEEALRRRPAECAFTGELLVAFQHVPSSLSSCRRGIYFSSGYFWDLFRKSRSPSSSGMTARSRSRPRPFLRV